MSKPMNSWGGDKADKERDGEHREKYLCAVCSPDSPARLHRHSAKVWVRTFTWKVWFHHVVVFVLKALGYESGVAAVSQRSVDLWVFHYMHYALYQDVCVCPGVGPTLARVGEGRLYLSRAPTASKLESFPMNSCTPWALCTSSLALTGTTMSPSCGQTFGGVISKGQEGSRGGGGHLVKNGKLNNHQ